MKVYYSINDAIKWLTTLVKKEGLDADITGGWGHFIRMTESALIESGIELVDSVKDADIELHVGQPILYKKPQMHPSIMFTMTETTGLPNYWKNTLNLFDEIIVPCKWNKYHFVRNGVKVPVHKVNLAVDIDKFPYIERDINAKLWVFLGQCVNYMDRKNIDRVGEIFRENKMPSDTFLLVKSNPKMGRPPVKMFMHKQIWLLNEKLPYDDMIKEVHAKSHVSVNPSSGEGFGWLPCLTDKTVVMTSKSVKPIEDVCVGDFVLTHKGRFRKVLKTFPKYYDSAILSIKTICNAIPFEVTGSHIIPVYRNTINPYLEIQSGKAQNKIQWISARDIQVGDYLLQPKYIRRKSANSLIDVSDFVNNIEKDERFVWHKWSYSISREHSYNRLEKLLGISNRMIQKAVQDNPNEYISYKTKQVILNKLEDIGYKKPVNIKFPRYWLLDTQLAYILGLYVAEGSTTGGAFEFDFHQDESDYIQTVYDFFKKLGVNGKIHYKNDSKGCRVSFSSKLIGTFFSNICGKGAKNKHIPSFIFGANPIIQQSFIKGIFDGDGYIDRKRHNASVTTISKQLAYEVKHLLHNLGYIASITTMFPQMQLWEPSSGKNYLSIGNLAYTLKVAGRQLENSDFLDENWGSWNARQRFMFDDKYYYLKVKNIQHVPYKGYVYDLKVEEDETFCIHSNVIVHNCEHSLTGMLSIQTNYSGLTETLKDGCNLGLKYREVTSRILSVGGKDAYPDFNHLIELMMWSYENREESMAMGKRASKWIRETFTKENMVNNLLPIMENVIKEVPKKINKGFLNDDIEEWVNVEAVKLFGLSQ